MPARLETLATFALELRPGRAQDRSLAQVVREFPVVQMLIDATEQRVRRPTGWEQKPWYRARRRRI